MEVGPLERAARKLAARENIDPSAHTGTDGRANWMLFVPLARAVIEAIREPSEAMEAAWVGNAGGSSAKLDWQSMVDVILSESKTIED